MSNPQDPPPEITSTSPSNTTLKKRKKKSQHLEKHGHLRKRNDRNGQRFGLAPGEEFETRDARAEECWPLRARRG